jgi:hypothetical protein
LERWLQGEVTCKLRLEGQGRNSPGRVGNWGSCVGLWRQALPLCNPSQVRKKRAGGREVTDMAQVPLQLGELGDACTQSWLCFWCSDYGCGSDDVVDTPFSSPQLPLPFSSSPDASVGLPFPSQSLMWRGSAQPADQNATLS